MPFVLRWMHNRCLFAKQWQTSEVCSRNLLCVLSWIYTIYNLNTLPIRFLGAYVGSLSQTFLNIFDNLRLSAYSEVVNSNIFERFVVIHKLNQFIQALVAPDGTGSNGEAGEALKASPALSRNCKLMANYLTIDKSGRPPVLSTVCPRGQGVWCHGAMLCHTFLS